MYKFCTEPQDKIGKYFSYSIIIYTMTAQRTARWWGLARDLISCRDKIPKSVILEVVINGFSILSTIDIEVGQYSIPGNFGFNTVIKCNISTTKYNQYL